MNYKKLGITFKLDFVIAYVYTDAFILCMRNTPGAADEAQCHQLTQDRER